MKILYFTATGNSLYVAKKLGGQLLSIPQLVKAKVDEIEDDAVGVVCPVYCGELPRMVREFLLKAKVITNYFFFVLTYGMNETTARFHAGALCDEIGLRLDYADAVLMVDNYLPGFEMRKQMDSVAQKDIEGQLARITDHIRQRKKQTVTVSPLKKAEMALIHRAMGKRILTPDAAKHYIVTDACIRCGVCERVCPADNVKVADTVTFGSRCEVCFACVHNCPQGAIHLKNEKSAVRFRNENVSLSEISDSNGRPYHT